MILGLNSGVVMVAETLIRGWVSIAPLNTFRDPANQFECVNGAAASEPGVKERIKRWRFVKSSVTNTLTSQLGAESEMQTLVVT